MNRCLSLFGGLILIATGMLNGCAPKQTDVAAAQAPAIPVSQPVAQQVTDFVDFTGRTEAKEAVNIIPRVTGYLLSTPFKEGAEIKRQDVLFEIDPKPYQAQYDQAEGQVVLNEARVKEAKADNARAKELSRTPGAISKQDLDRYQAAEEEAIASVQAAKASLEVYRINLGYCKVASPIDGQVSRYYLTPGNLVNQDQTQLTTVVSTDPMYVYFDMDESTLLLIRRAVNEGRLQRYQQGQIPVFIGLEGEEGFPEQGSINFVNNQVNSGTGSITVRGEVANPKPKNGTRLLSPGMFVRVRLPIGKPHPALLVIDRALGSDQGLKYAFVVGPNNTIEQRRVETGPLQENGLRVIESGLKADEWVVVGAIQQVRSRMQIRPDRVTMPTLGTAAESVTSESGSAGSQPAPSSAVKSRAGPEKQDAESPQKKETTPAPTPPAGAEKRDEKATEPPPR
jgi:membrane fusion protein, multidrug efflux system